MIVITCQGTADGNQPLAKFGTMHEMETFMLKLCMVPFQKKKKDTSGHTIYNIICCAFVK